MLVYNEIQFERRPGALSSERITVISASFLLCRGDLFGPVVRARFLHSISSRRWRCKTHWQWYFVMWQCTQLGWAQCRARYPPDKLLVEKWRRHKMVKWIEMLASMNDESTHAEYESGHSTTRRQLATVGWTPSKPFPQTYVAIYLFIPYRAGNALRISSAERKKKSFHHLPHISNICHVILFHKLHLCRHAINL